MAAWRCRLYGQEDTGSTPVAAPPCRFSPEWLCDSACWRSRSAARLSHRVVMGGGGRTGKPTKHCAAGRLSAAAPPADFECKAALRAVKARLKAKGRSSATRVIGAWHRSAARLRTWGQRGLLCHLALRESREAYYSSVETSHLFGRNFRNADSPVTPPSARLAPPRHSRGWSKGAGQ